MSMVDLKRMCKDRELAVSGVKSDLIVRLVNFEADEDVITPTQKQYVRDIETKSGIVATDAELSYKRFASRYILENEVKAGYNRRTTPGGYTRDGSEYASYLGARDAGS